MTLAKEAVAQNRPYSAQSVCAYCGVGCGVEIDMKDEQPKSIRGTSDHPANFGRLCVKGQHLLDTIGYEDRLLYPEINHQRASWAEAVEEAAKGLSNIITKHGPEAVAFYVSGQLLTEDYYLANKLMKGYIGSANIDTNSRLCMSSAVAAYKRAFGEDVVPCDYEDLEQTDLLILIGSNAAWTHPVLYQRMERAKRLNPDMRVVLVDPRRTASAELSDQFLQIKPGSDAGLYNGLLNYLTQHNGLDQAFLEQYTEHYDAAIEASQHWSLQRTAEFCGVLESELKQFYHWFLSSERVVSFYSMGINQSSSGVDKCQAIINAHLASGKILRPGCGPFSITGQPNAMGGREVGGLANQLTAHMELQDPDDRARVQNYWQSPAMANKPGKMAVDMFSEIAAGNIKAVWIMATNPLVSLPNRPDVIRALERCELVIVSECVDKSDTLPFADIKFPASAWLEKNGTVTNSERRISRQRGLIPSPAEAKPDWEIIADVAQAMGFSGFDYQHPAEIFDEWVKLTAHENQDRRQLNLGELGDLSLSEYDQLKPVQWPLSKNGGRAKPFEQKRFSTASGKARLFAIEPKLPKQVVDAAFPFLMNSGRLRDQWHTMSRTGRSASLNGHIDRPYIYINPKDAITLGVKPGGLIKAASRISEVTAFAQISDDIASGQCFMPIHWSEQFASSANVSNLYASIVDPISGQPESKQAAVKLEAVGCGQFIQIYSKAELPFHEGLCVKSRGHYGFHYLLAFQAQSHHVVKYLQKRFQADGEWLSFSSGGTENVVCLGDGDVMLLAFSGEQAPDISKEWLDQLFAKESLTLEDIQSVLRRRADEAFEQGPKVCSCFNVHQKTIVDEIQLGASSVEELGRRLRCGSNCGSCKPELSQLISTHHIPQSCPVSESA
ncbi:nitrate reductase [Pseudoteredinibacter isoporae]|uniref:Assimilatory nitrate reductase catalytic subunit n=1 Tax=Pseudoteredinibacter isoporae TaxID=570281 RepID=A0A7X0MWG1_9GAMM|nr:nitrate reductase [Pseudoteredinibacter isoporae]MBB6519812.1 assimilatory nitrate reductase catalytic subunit [Pseudoteredinibacter isoporae]NHO85392.1 nitrate reductase [Pseudoteredinibacter isoporae]NIB26156.1 nitrate reductase [Pseudoteredinibacter isoporae]